MIPLSNDRDHVEEKFNKIRYYMAAVRAEYFVDDIVPLTRLWNVNLPLNQPSRRSLTSVRKCSEKFLTLSTCAAI